MILGQDLGFIRLLAEWSEHDVVEKYLRPINMEHLAKLFTENRINGAVLMALEVYYIQLSSFVGVSMCGV